MQNLNLMQWQLVMDAV